MHGVERALFTEGVARAIKGELRLWWMRERARQLEVHVGVHRESNCRWARQLAAQVNRERGEREREKEKEKEKERGGE